MPLVPAKCTVCGAEITVDNTKEALICEKCNSAFIVSKAIESYESENKPEAFEITEGVLKRYRGDEEDVIIPDNVTRIGGGAFLRHENLRSVLIPESVAEIGDYAFAYCTSLQSVKSSFEDGDGCVAFSGNLRYIGDHAFRSCTSLPPVILFKNRDRIYHDGDPVFRHCYEDKESVRVTQKGHTEPRMYSKVGSFDMELTPLSNHLFGHDFDKKKVKYENGRDGTEKYEKNDGKSGHSGSESGGQRQHRSDVWKKLGLCAHCGGSFGLMKKCKSCGMKKDY